MSSNREEIDVIEVTRHDMPALAGLPWETKPLAGTTFVGWSIGAVKIFSRITASCATLTAARFCICRTGNG